VAEREGFEPSVEVSPYTRLAGERLQPARPSLRDSADAEDDLLLAYSIEFSVYYEMNQLVPIHSNGAKAFQRQSSQR
jgi:hypothetical protein